MSLATRLLASACLLLLNVTHALLGDVYTLASPASRSNALQLATNVQPTLEHEHWACVSLAEPALPSVDYPLQNMDAIGGPRMPLGRKPIAVGRLRRGLNPPIIDHIRCSVPKEDPLAIAAVGLVVDALLLSWAEWLLREGAGSKFEELLACSSLAYEEALLSRGFRPLDDADVDFSVLARGSAPPMASARLPTGLLAAKTRAAKQSGLDRAHTEALVAALSGLEPPASTATAADNAAGGSTHDPWSGIRGFGNPV